jgi:hypothetical protein
MEASWNNDDWYRLELSGELVARPASFRAFGTLNDLPSQNLDALRQGLAQAATSALDHGTEGRFAQGNADRVPNFAAELITPIVDGHGFIGWTLRERAGANSQPLNSCRICRGKRWTSFDPQQRVAILSEEDTPRAGWNPLEQANPTCAEAGGLSAGRTLEISSGFAPSFSLPMACRSGTVLSRCRKMEFIQSPRRRRLANAGELES